MGLVEATVPRSPPRVASPGVSVCRGDDEVVVDRSGSPAAERRKAEAAEATEARAKAEALATTLRLQIEKAGLEGAGEALTLRDMAAVKSDSGVYEAIGKLPDVPVLQKLTESIDTATRSLNELRDEKLASMAVVGEIDADGPSATGSTEPAPMT